MLTALHVQDFVLIESLALDVGIGLTALTGETGAGKSILLDALGLASGGRASKGAVRRGAAMGVVTAVFEPLASHPVWRVLEDNGVTGDDDQIILKRIQNPDGKSRAFINDQPVSVTMLREIGGMLIEIHGQHDGVSFLSSPTHRRLLDEFGRLQAGVATVSTEWRKWRAAVGALDEKRRARGELIREADYLRHVVGELSDLAPREGEETELAARRAELIASEKVIDDLTAAENLLSEEGFEGRLSACAHRLARASAAFPGTDNPLENALERLDQALSAVMEARSAVEDTVTALGLDPAELDAVEERLFALRAAARKHGVAPDMLQQVLDKATTSLGDLDAGEADFASLETEARRAETAYRKLAADLTARRKTTAQKLDQAVMHELGPLKLGKAHFVTEISTKDEFFGEEGADRVEFMIATNPGAAAGPLKTIASGGELSRFVLAMKAALAAKENRTVIIFDEVDAGVGGAVADAVGERLARLAIDAQVIVVTHSPQVAARASAHWRVVKEQTKSETRTSVTLLDNDARNEEIARMLSGATVTPEARAAAAKLLAADVSGVGQPLKAPAVRRRKKSA
jgi:DNA repair protein RecN (Recombination protein N)